MIEKGMRMECVLRKEPKGANELICSPLTMAPRSPASLFFFFFFFFFLINFSAAAASATCGKDNLTAYEALASYDFPPGLLPQGALGYELEDSTGAFKAYLNGSCSFSLEGSYQLRYKSTITGVISPGRLSDLRGVSVKILLFWVNIIEARRLTDSLRFSVGIASADFALSNFYVSPRCGCGLNCPDDYDSHEAVSGSPSDSLAFTAMR